MVWDWLLFGALAVLAGGLAGVVTAALASRIFRTSWDSEREERLVAVESGLDGLLERLEQRHMASISRSGVEARAANESKREGVMALALQIIANKEVPTEEKGKQLALAAQNPDVALWLVKKGVKF
jgi:hypothetical protein